MGPDGGLWPFVCQSSLKLGQGVEPAVFEEADKNLAAHMPEGSASGTGTFWGRLESRGREPGRAASFRGQSRPASRPRSWP